jgi:hypothetical protein
MEDQNASGNPESAQPEPPPRETSKAELSAGQDGPPKSAGLADVLVALVAGEICVVDVVELAGADVAGATVTVT